MLANASARVFDDCLYCADGSCSCDIGEDTYNGPVDESYDSYTIKSDGHDAFKERKAENANVSSDSKSVTEEWHEYEGFKALREELYNDRQISYNAQTMNTPAKSHTTTEIPKRPIPNFGTVYVAPSLPPTGALCRECWNGGWLVGMGAYCRCSWGDYCEQMSRWRTLKELFGGQGVGSLSSTASTRTTRRSLEDSEVGSSRTTAANYPVRKSFGNDDIKPSRSTFDWANANTKYLICEKCGSSGWVNGDRYSPCLCEGRFGEQDRLVVMMPGYDRELTASLFSRANDVAAAAQADPAGSTSPIDLTTSNPTATDLVLTQTKSGRSSSVAASIALNPEATAFVPNNSAYPTTSLSMTGSSEFLPNYSGFYTRSSGSSQDPVLIDHYSSPYIAPHSIPEDTNSGSGLEWADDALTTLNPFPLLSVQIRNRGFSDLTSLFTWHSDTGVGDLSWRSTTRPRSKSLDLNEEKHDFDI